MQNITLRTFILLVISLAIVRGLIYCLIIPFDQAPDEKDHFLLIKAKQQQLKGASAEETQAVAARVEAAWYALLYPEASQETRSWELFKDKSLLSSLPSWRIYYLTTATILNICSLRDIRNEIYLMRGFSILCGAMVVGLSIRIARDLFPDQRFPQLGIPLFIVFIPQFSAMNGVINNDKLAEVFTTLLFWILVRIFRDGLSWAYGSAYLMTMGAALFSKRTTYFLLPLSIIAIFMYFWKGRIGLRMHLHLFGGMLLVILLLYGLLWHPAVYTWVHDRIISIPEAKDLPRALFRPELFTPAMLLHIVKFFIIMYWGFWGIFGYMTIHLHHFWYVAAAFVQGLAMIGMGLLTVRAKRHTWLVEQWQTKIYYLFAASIVLSLIIPVFRSVILLFGESPDLSQGRYLFTIMVPISSLTLLGLATLFSSKHYRWVGGMSLAALCLLDTVVLFDYLFLNFHYATLF